jgi:hypothetical protein
MAGLPNQVTNLSHQQSSILEEHIMSTTTSRAFLTIPIAALTLTAAGMSAAWADAPTVQITEPSGQIFLSPADFPYAVNVKALLTHSELKDLNALDVLVNGSSILEDAKPIGNPFNNSNVCSSNINNNEAVTSCSTYVADNTLGSNQARVGVNWSIPDFGSYTLEVSVKHQSAVGEDEETLEVLSLSVEWPAPPAVANAYLKDYPGVLASKKQHGCVISQIAQMHAKDSFFGPKGGPYDTDLIEDWVVSFASSCPLK